MAVVTFQRLSDEDRDRVEAKIKKNFSVTIRQKEAQLSSFYGSSEIGIEESELPCFSDFREDVQEGMLVVAMRSLGIKPAIPGERWRRLNNSFATFAYLDLDAKGDAERYLLENHGIDIHTFYASEASAEPPNQDQ